MSGRPAFLALAAAALPACLAAPPSSTEPHDGPDGGGGLLAAFRFEPGGLLADSSGNGHDGVCSGLECPLEVDGPSGHGQAALFDGVDDLVSIESVGSGPFTVMVWLRLDLARSGALACPINKPFDVDGHNTWQLCLRSLSGDLADLYFYSSQPPYGQTVQVAMELATWHHVALRWDQDSKTIFWDGDPVANEPGETEFDGSTIRLGSDIDGAEQIALFPGALDDVEIHDRPLSNLEITQAASP